MKIIAYFTSLALGLALAATGCDKKKEAPAEETAARPSTAEEQPAGGTEPEEETEEPSPGDLDEPAGQGSTEDEALEEELGLE